MSCPLFTASFPARVLVGEACRERRARSEATLDLESRGWHVVRVWEHEIFLELDKVVRVTEAAIRGERPPIERDWRVVRVVPVPEEGVDWERRELRLLPRTSQNSSFFPRTSVNKACGRPDRTRTAGEGMHTSSGIMRQRVLGGERAQGIGTGRSEESEPLEGVL
jgi:hypothetical protein